MCSRRPSTLTITLLLKRQRQFVVTQNIFFNCLKLHKRFDLKGSWISRTAKRNKTTGDVEGVLKDNDLNYDVLLRSDEAAELAVAMKKDAEFLCSHNIMDYSLVIGVHNSRFEVDAGRLSKELQFNEMKASGGKRLALKGKGTSGGGIVREAKSDSTDSSDGSAGMDSESDIKLERLPRRTRRHSSATFSFKEAKALREGTQSSQNAQAHLARHVEGPGVFYMGIIDILQEVSLLSGSSIFSCLFPVRS